MLAQMLCKYLILGWLIPKDKISKFCYIPNAKIVDFLEKKKIPNICFPKGLKEKYLKFNEQVNPDGISDCEIDPVWAKDKLKNVVIQGGLNSKILLKNEKEILKGRLNT